MKNFKRTMVLLLAVLLAMPLFLSGCGKKAAGPLRIVVDVGGAGRYGNLQQCQVNFENLMKNIVDYGGPEDYEVEFIPEDEADRQSTIKHIKTELMSGSGPDLFIVDAYDGNFYGDVQPMFPIPEQLIERRVFLPLDEYIENTQFCEWEKLTPKVMEAGRGSEGQILVPIAYNLPLTCYREEDYQHDISAALTWQDMLDGGDVMLRRAGQFLTGVVNAQHDVSCVFTQLADYDTEELAFSQDELWEVLEQKLVLAGEDLKGEWDEMPTAYRANLSANLLPQHSSIGSWEWENLYPEQPMTMVPMYNKEGGLTAKVTTFAAINRNTKRAEEAFFVLDYLLSKNATEHSEFYSWVIKSDRAMVMDTDMCSEGHSMHMGRGMCQENYAQIGEIRDAITSVSFANILDHEIEMMLYDAFTVLVDEAGDEAETVKDAPTIETCSPETREKLEAVAAEAYRLMVAELGES